MYISQYEPQQLVVVISPPSIAAGILDALMKTMKVACTEWYGWIAPVPDVAGTVFMVETERPDNISERSMRLLSESSSAQVSFLAEHEVNVWVYGLDQVPGCLHDHHQLRQHSKQYNP